MICLLGAIPDKAPPDAALRVFSRSSKPNLIKPELKPVSRR
jgi:hypothetical protein